MVQLPLDVIRHIIGYCQDIDVRRSFGVYHNVQIPPVVNSCILTLREHGSVQHNSITRYSLPNLVERKDEDIMDDSIQVVMIEMPDSGYLLYEIDIYRIKPRTFRRIDIVKETEYVMPLGSLQNHYYWDVYLYSYIRRR